MTIDHTPITMNVLSQNVLLDKTRTAKGLILPQDERIEAIAATLQAFPGQLDVVGVQEAHQSSTQHNGQHLAETCGYDRGLWLEHNQKPYPGSPTGRAGEHVGLFGAAVGEEFASIELGDNRRAIMTEIAGVAFVNLHFRAGIKARQLRHSQARAIVEALGDYDDAVVFGDFNEPPVSHYAKARESLGLAGLESVFSLTNQPQPITFPTDFYRKSRTERTWSLDDILVRGERVQALAAGVLRHVVPDTVPRGGSDHEGIWARLEIV